MNKRLIFGIIRLEIKANFIMTEKQSPNHEVLKHISVYVRSIPINIYISGKFKGDEYFQVRSYYPMTEILKVYMRICS